MHPIIGVVILNWNNWEDTLECIHSISLCSYPLDRIKLIVVDNGSDDGSVENLRSLDSIELIELPSNLGFSAGNNIGIKEALDSDCKYILIQNNDTTVHPNFFGALLSGFNAKGSVGITVPKIVYKGNSDVIWYAGGKFKHPRVLGELIGYQKKDSEKYNRPQETDFAVGCSMMVHREVFQKVGFFDEDFFLYHEDIDFSLRTKAEGFCIQYQPLAVVEHEVYSSTKNLEGIRVYYEAQSRIVFLKKHIPLRDSLPVLILESLRIFRTTLRYGTAGQVNLAFEYILGTISGFFPESNSRHFKSG